MRASERQHFCVHMCVCVLEKDRDRETEKPGHGCIVLCSSRWHPALRRVPFRHHLDRGTPRVCDARCLHTRMRMSARLFCAVASTPNIWLRAAARTGAASSPAATRRTPCISHRTLSDSSAVISCRASAVCLLPVSATEAQHIATCHVEVLCEVSCPSSASPHPPVIVSVIRSVVCSQCGSSVLAGGLLRSLPYPSHHTTPLARRGCLVLHMWHTVDRYPHAQPPTQGVSLPRSLPLLQGSHSGRGTSCCHPEPVLVCVWLYRPLTSCRRRRHVYRLWLLCAGQGSQG